MSSTRYSRLQLRRNHLQVLGLQWGRMGLTRRDGFTFCVVVHLTGRSFAGPSALKWIDGGFFGLRPSQYKSSIAVFLGLRRTS